MKKLIVFNRISLDGLFAGPNGEINEWFIHDQKLDDDMHKTINADTVLLGRTTYELFEQFWPKIANDVNASAEEKNISKELNQMRKLVASRTLTKVTWQNSELIKSDLATEIRKEKNGKGSDIVIFGSGTIIQQLANDKLIDEYLIAITPVILGDGKSFFSHVNRLDLTLIKTTHYDTGNVLIHYSSENKKA